MIQRLQSVYLFLVAALVATCMFMPLTTIVTPEDTVILSSLGAYAPAPESKLLFEMWPLTIVAALAALLSLINIFLFRNRPLQMRVCHFTTLLLVTFYVIVGIYIYDLYIALNGESLVRCPHIRANSSRVSLLLLPIKICTLRLSRIIFATAGL